MTTADIHARDAEHRRLSAKFWRAALALVVAGLCAGIAGENEVFHAPITWGGVCIVSFIGSVVCVIVGAVLMTPTPPLPPYR